MKTGVRLALLLLGGLVTMAAGPVLWANGYRGTDLAGILAGFFFGYVGLVVVMALAASTKLRGGRRSVMRGIVLAFGGVFLWMWLVFAHFNGSGWIGGLGFAAVLVSVLADWLSE